MADANSKLRNGFKVVTDRDVIDFASVAMENAEQLRTVFASIKRLTPEADAELQGLAALGKNLADMLYNDIDVIGEPAEKAGVIGKEVPEVHHG